MTPNSLDDLLALLPGLRKLRSMNADLLRVLLDRPKRSCTWCGGVLPKRRISWCSDACVTAFNLRCSSNHTRKYVIERDRGVCQICERNIHEAMAEANRLGLNVFRWINGEKPEERKARQAAHEVEKQKFGWGRGRWFEVDHTLPVAEGGGLCPVEKLRLVCGVCHARVTADLKGRLAKQR